MVSSMRPRALWKGKSQEGACSGSPPCPCIRITQKVLKKYWFLGPACQKIDSICLHYGPSTGDFFFCKFLCRILMCSQGWEPLACRDSRTCKRALSWIQSTDVFCLACTMFKSNFELVSQPFKIESWNSWKISGFLAFEKIRKTGNPQPTFWWQQSPGAGWQKPGRSTLVATVSHIHLCIGTI